MKRILFFVFALMIMFSGCTRTVNGIQQDTTNAWNGAKDAIHNATAP